MPRTSVRAIACTFPLTLAAALAACTQTLPAPEADAFRTMATLSRDDFARRVQQEFDAQVAGASRELRANRGRVLVSGCGSQDKTDCIVTYTDGTLSVPLVSAAPKARALIGSVANYSTRMAELAEAKDLAALRTKAEAASGAAKALALVALPAGPLAGLMSPLIDAAFWAQNARRVDRRRLATRDIAFAAQPAIEQAVATLTAMTGPLRETAIDEHALRLNRTYNAITLGQTQERRLRSDASKSKGAKAAELHARADKLRDRRVAEFETLMKQQSDLNALRATGVDYGKLSDAHSTLIDKLSDPDVSLENAMRDLDFIVATAGAAKDAIKSKPDGE